MQKYEMVGQAESGFDPNAQYLNAEILNRPSFSHVKVQLDNGQKVMADNGAMIWMDGDMQMETWCYGGVMNALCRPLAFESCCMNTFEGPGEVSFGFDMPGDSYPFAVSPAKGWILTSGAFICGTENIVVGCRCAGLKACCCAGEGAFLTKITVGPESGNGVFYAGGMGAIQRHDVAAGQIFFIDTGLFFAAAEDIQIDVGLPGDFKSCCCGGEGFVMKFTGPCTVYTQNRDPAEFLKLLRPQPQGDSGNQDGGGGGGGD